MDPLIALAIQSAFAGVQTYLKFKSDNAAAIAALAVSDQAVIAELDKQVLADDADDDAADAEANKALGR
jgi:hypothetical protein